MPKYIKSSKYEIIYDYCDEIGNCENDCIEDFEGTWWELQDYLKQMRKNGCYHIDVNEIVTEDEDDGNLELDVQDYLDSLEQF